MNHVDTSAAKIAHAELYTAPSSAWQHIVMLLTILHNTVEGENTMPPKSSHVNVAQAKKSLSELIGRIAYGQETITILKRGRPVARLVPVNERTRRPLAEAKGWLHKKDRFFRIMDEILAARHARRPRRHPSLKD